MDPYYLFVTAISLASIYGLLAIGISIIWSSLGMINLAQGFIFTVSGYGAWLVAHRRVGVRGLERAHPPSVASRGEFLPARRGRSFPAAVSRTARAPRP